MSKIVLPEPPSTQKRLAWATWALIALAAVGVAFFSAPPYFTFNASESRIPLNPEVALHFLWVSLHAVPGVLALAIGPFQFLPALLRRYPALHRNLGRVYLGCILVGGVMGIVSAVVSVSGLAAQLGFLLLAVAWLYSGLMAYLTVRRGQYGLHRVWMIRNYSFTFAAVLLRVFLGIGIWYTTVNPAVPFAEVYTSAAWCSILVSYVVAEWFIVGRTLRLPALKPDRTNPSRAKPLTATTDA